MKLYSGLVISLIITCLSQACSSDTQVHANTRSKINHSFSHVTECEPDFLGGQAESFCDVKHISSIKQAISTKNPDFYQHYIFLLIPKQNVAGDTAVIIDSLTGIVYPLPFAVAGSFVDDKGFDINNKKLKVYYSINSNKICFEGSLYAYRDTYTNSFVCYLFKNNIFEKCIDDQPCMEAVEKQ